MRRASEPSDQAPDVRLIIDTIPTLTWSARPDGSAEFFNRRWLDYTGLSAEQALDWGWKLAIHPDDLPRLLQNFQEAVDAEGPFEAEGRLRRFDGEFRWFLFRGSPLRDESGNVVKWYGTNTDIEDRKRGEDALRISEESFRATIDNIPGLVNTMSPSGELEFANQRWLDYYGKTLEEMKGWETSDVIHPDDLPRAAAAWKQSVETGQPFEIEHRIRRADGVYRWFQGRSLPLRDCEGRIVRWYSLIIDIDERKQAEEKLRRTEAFLLEAQRLSHTGGWRHDLSSGTVTTWPESSTEMLRVFGAQPGEDTLAPEFWFNRIHPDDRQRVLETFSRCETEKTEYRADYRIVLPDGTIKYQHSVGHPILNQSGDLVEFVGTAMDTTEQWQARLDLEKAFGEIQLLKDQLYKENIALRDEVDRTSMFEEIVGNSRALQAVLSRAAKVAPTDSNVLIIGETGTGKELIARAVHKRSLRSERAFVSVNCAALAPSLISSELFGHEKGAFTGATQRKPGRFELAEGGTIFLDEVGELPSDTQIALLRVLQEREFERVGGTQTIRVDVRVIAATNRDLHEATAAGTFRRDLFYRLNVFPIEVPPLRNRKDDIPILLDYFVHRFSRKVAKHFANIDKRTLELFRSYPWPGNIRELQNVVERSVILSADHTFCVDESWLSSDSRRMSLQPSEPDYTNESAIGERRIIEAALRETRGRVSGPNGAAAKLGVPPSTLDSRIKKLKIRKSPFKFS
jgi:PAS domain S-box-containing protein